jgi:cyclic pyranopterin phosphate synthase
MTDRVIPLLDTRVASVAAPRPAEVEPASGHVEDRLGRPLRDLRISVTDRCNFRCTYCMPKEIFDRDYRFLPHAELLSFEEITQLARVFIRHGVEKIRLTGGEPLLRKDLHKLIGMLAPLQTRGGHGLDLALTTNGSILGRKARQLADAGLKRITVSLDGLDEAVFRQMNDVDFPVSDVLNGIDAAASAGLGPIKINMVVKRGVNDHEILPMARRFRGTGHIVRFIEFMDVGSVERLAHGRRRPLGRCRAPDFVRASARTDRLELRRRSRRALALSRRQRRDRRDLQRDAGFLPRLHARPPLDGGQALSVPVRESRL